MLGASSPHEFSDATQSAIDAEVSRLVTHAQEQAQRVLEQHRRELDQLMTILLEHETVDGDAVYALFAAPSTVPFISLVPAAATGT
jgi:cell division protease FtsH